MKSWCILSKGTLSDVESCDEVLVFDYLGIRTGRPSQSLMHSCDLSPNFVIVLMLGLRDNTQKRGRRRRKKAIWEGLLSLSHYTAQITPRDVCVTVCVGIHLRGSGRWRRLIAAVNIFNQFSKVQKIMEITRAMIALIGEITGLLPVIMLNHFPRGKPIRCKSSTIKQSSHLALFELPLADTQTC